MPTRIVILGQTASAAWANVDRVGDSVSAFGAGEIFYVGYMAELAKPNTKPRGSVK